MCVCVCVCARVCVRVCVCDSGGGGVRENPTLSNRLVHTPPTSFINTPQLQ